MSRIGKKPVELPSGVTASVSGQSIEVKGPKGTRSFKATDDVDLKVEDNVVHVTPRGKSKRARQQWGMSRTMVANRSSASPIMTPCAGTGPTSRICATRSK